ncbi:MAG: hypothetical protein KME29_15505 [Calothrix sp. FI2-JRJ7]|jgi:hypothetical protein|nr:hypothetical protein [Calothrix sp. FI2-JRJ7]
MADHLQTTTDTAALNGANKQQLTQKKQRRKALPNATASSTTRAEMTIKAVISSSPKAVSNDDFPLYKLFVLDSTGNGELFIKVTKHKIINVVTGDAFSSSTTGYLLSL